jgi:hypothetical protein
MASIKSYVSGRILDEVKMALALLKYNRIPILGSLINKLLIQKVTPFGAKVIDLAEATHFIKEARYCATGERICRKIHPESQVSESVFLDDLALGLVKSGSAELCSSQEAIDVLKKYRTPIIISKVSGKYVEICNSVPKSCVYWQFEKQGLRCLSKKV